MLAVTKFERYSWVSINPDSVRVPHAGDRTTDYRAANRAAGFGDTADPPRGMTWHHHQDGYTMQLVPRDIRRGTGHTGSIGIDNLPGKK